MKNITAHLEVEGIDDLVLRGVYKDRSEVIRNAVRKKLLEYYPLVGDIFSR